MPRKFLIKTYGCQMNVNDSEIIAGILTSKGIVETNSIEDADIIITNTCSVRDGAERKAKGFIGDLLNVKKQRPSVIIGVVGCMAERLAKDLLNNIKHIDFVLGPNQESKIAEVIEKSGEKTIEIGDSKEFKPSNLAKRGKSGSAWITVMEGCNNFCSYCIVPYVRGREKSRPMTDIIREIEELDKNIFKEIILLGQNVNSYQFGFAELLNNVADINGIQRIRFMTSHPKDMNDAIISVVAENNKICECFHVPFQSGDDEILKKMNRGYSRDYYMNIVKKIRKAIPHAAITSDAIAGFPSETDAQFENTLNLIRELELDSINTLAFDPRPGTVAEKMEGKISQPIISERLQRLMKVVGETTLANNKKLIGTTQELLMEEDGKGRTRTNKIVKVADSSIKQGEIVNVRIDSAMSWVLQGALIN